MAPYPVLMAVRTTNPSFHLGVLGLIFGGFPFALFTLSVLIHQFSTLIFCLSNTSGMYSQQFTVSLSSKTYISHNSRTALKQRYSQALTIRYVQTYANYDLLSLVKEIVPISYVLC